MKLTFLGSGSAFTVGFDNFHSNMVLDNGSGQKLLIDCGSDARLSLHELGLTHRDIDSVYISHLHADHVGGLEWLAFTTKFDLTCKKPNLFIAEDLADDLWQKVLSGGLSSIQMEIAELSTYFNVHLIKEDGHFIWSDTTFQTIKTIHIVNGFSLMPSYGVIFTADHKTVFITTDMQFSPRQVNGFYEKADIIFQDCETSANKSHVHAHYEQLVTLPDAIKKKMWLYHYNPGKLPDAKQDGFNGFVKKGQSFDLSAAL